MEADGQLLWKPRASHESHLANFSRIAERGGHDGGCLREQRAQLLDGCGGPGKRQPTEQWPAQVGTVDGAVVSCEEAGVV